MSLIRNSECDSNRKPTLLRQAIQRLCFSAKHTICAIMFFANESKYSMVEEEGTSAASMALKSGEVHLQDSESLEGKHRGSMKAKAVGVLLLMCLVAVGVVVRRLSKATPSPSNIDGLTDLNDNDAKPYSLDKTDHTCSNRAGFRGSNDFSRNLKSAWACWEYASSVKGCGTEEGSYFSFNPTTGWCDCVAQDAGPCNLEAEAGSNVYKMKHKACVDKIPNCEAFKASGVCGDSHVDKDMWRTDCVKTCGHCSDPKYNGACLKGNCGEYGRDDQNHLLTISSIKCIKPSAAVGTETKLALTGAAVVAAAGFTTASCVATAGGCAFTAPLIGKLAGTLGTLATAGQAAVDAAGAIKTAESVLNTAYSGTDELIVKVNGVQVLPAPGIPCRGYYMEKKDEKLDCSGYNCQWVTKVTDKGNIPACKINAGETINAKIEASFQGAATIQLMEYDYGSDNDDLGWFQVDPSRNPHEGQDMVVYSAAEDTIYMISYKIDHGKGNKEDIPATLQCGTVECRPCEGASCRDHSGLDRDGDLHDLKACPGNYVHDRYERFPQWWPFSDVYLRICKLA
eukprot:TRINITY_DN77135_c0_g1_i1.p1 TRINITY_DN77135_c0_g1~~TRINITY_DN77135_c0_g1_i1.p1  ORF type:complete len:568 (-),score=101.20 TRINITY_DN77135_c0_g1_i1:276-1979(-)